MKRIEDSETGSLDDVRYLINKLAPVKTANKAGQDINFDGFVSSYDKVHWLVSSSFPVKIGDFLLSGELQVFATIRTAFQKRPSVRNVFYLILALKTRQYGEIRWHIHINGENVFLGLYSDNAKTQRHQLKGLMTTIEKNLRGSGFIVRAGILCTKKDFENLKNIIDVRG